MSIDTFLLSADTTDLNYPEVRPTLDLNFARVKALDPRITFTRSSGGSYVGADGLIKLAGVNQARFDHNPVTGESLGLLVEEARSNLVTDSEQFDNAAWGKTNTGITTNTSATTAPDGNTTADKLVENSANGIHILSQSAGTISGTYALSCFVKAAGRYKGYIQLYSSGGNAAAFFDLNLGTITASTGTTTITPYPNDWYRVTASTTFTSALAAVYIVMNDNSGNSTYTGDGTSGVYLWGAQLEEGAFATSYIPTVASTRTRAADNASITGKNFRDFYNQSEGSIYSSFYPNTISTSSLGHFVFAFTDGTNQATTQNALNLLKRGNIDFSTRFSSSSSSGTNNSFINVGTWSTNKTNISSSYKENNFAAVKNGSTVLNNNLVNMPVNITTFYIGYRFEQSYLNGTISRLTYYPKRLPDAQLQALTR